LSSRAALLQAYPREGQRGIIASSSPKMPNNTLFCTEPCSESLQRPFRDQQYPLPQEKCPKRTAPSKRSAPPSQRNTPPKTNPWLRIWFVSSFVNMSGRFIATGLRRGVPCARYSCSVPNIAVRVNISGRRSYSLSRVHTGRMRPTCGGDALLAQTYHH